MSELLTTFDNALKEFAFRAVYWHSLAIDYKDGRRTARPTLPELRQWIATTRSLADRLPCGGDALRTLLMQAADRLAEALDWRDKYFLRWPSSLGTYADANWRVSLNLWAADQLMRAINQIDPQDVGRYQSITGDVFEPLRIPPTKFWPAMFAAIPQERIVLPFVEYKEAQKRVRGFEKTVKPRMREPLMLDVLSETLQNSHFHAGAIPRDPPEIV